jgi:thiol-disulfide isomerase/thioredoxin
MLLMAGLCLTGPGCALFKKTGGSSDRQPLFSTAGGKAPAKFPSGDPLLPTPGGNNGIAPPPPTAAGPAPGENALLAGRVVDAFNRPPANTTYIRWACLEENKENGAPIDVTVSPEGYFTIQGLKQGAQYKLIARSKQGEKLVAGVTYTQAPNVRVVIQVRDDLVTPSTPPIPDGTTPARQEPKESARAPGAWQPNPAIPSAAPTGLDLPAQLHVPTPQATTAPAPGGTPNWVPGVAADPAKQWPPTLNIAPQPRPAPAHTAPPQNVPRPPPLPTDARAPRPPLRVPTCVLVGDQLVNLALTDTTGQTWDFRTHKKGKLLLLDFWKTNCLPCRQGMPVLAQLQNRYGPQGLEVVGIAIEDGGSNQEQMSRINAVCYRLQTNYRQLLGENNRTNLAAQFGINAFPTLVLIDDTGRILWRHTGLPDQGGLDHIIQRQLSNRAF